MKYNELDGIRATQLKALATGGPAALYATTFGEKEDSPSLLFGRLAHELALLPEDKRTFAVNDKYPDFRSKEAREWRDSMAASGVTIVSAGDFERAQKVADRYREICADLFGERTDATQTELAVSTSLTGLGIKAKAQFDEVRGDAIIDLKTISSVLDFRSQFWRLRYDIQGGHYANVGSAELPTAPTRVVFVFVETAFPFRAAVLTLEGDELKTARTAAENYLKASYSLLAAGNDQSKYSPVVGNELAARPAWVEDPFLPVGL